MQSIRRWRSGWRAALSECTRADDYGGLRRLQRRAGAALELELQKLPTDQAAIPVHHYPPGTSKWNKIEHRLFCHITQNWRGRPLTTRLAVIELIGATTTKTGLKVDGALDARTYRKGIRVSKVEMNSLDIAGGSLPSLNGTTRSDPESCQTVALIVRDVLSLKGLVQGGGLAARSA